MLRDIQLPVPVVECYRHSLPAELLPHAVYADSLLSDFCLEAIYLSGALSMEARLAELLLANAPCLGFACEAPPEFWASYDAQDNPAVSLAAMHACAHKFGSIAYASSFDDTPEPDWNDASKLASFRQEWYQRWHSRIAVERAGVTA